MNRFYNHDRIINHDTNRKNKCKQSQQVNSEPKQLHKEEGTNDRHRNRDRGNERRPEILQEDKNYDKNQNESLHQRFHHLIDGFIQVFLCAIYIECGYTPGKIL